MKNGRADVLDADATLHAIEGCDLVYDCEAALTLLPFVPPRRYLRLFNLRNCYYAGSRFLDHVDNDRFDPWPWRFHPLFFFSHSFLPCRTLGLGPGRRFRPFSSRRLGDLACLTAHSRVSSTRFSSLFRSIQCFDNNGLYKQKGCWHGSSDSKPISGSTVADLRRDGMLTVTTNQQRGLARLTERGNWFVRTLIEAERI